MHCTDGKSFIFCRLPFDATSCFISPARWWNSIFNCQPRFTKAYLQIGTMNSRKDWRVKGSLLANKRPLHKLVLSLSKLLSDVYLHASRWSMWRELQFRQLHVQYKFGLSLNLIYEKRGKTKKKNIFFPLTWIVITVCVGVHPQNAKKTLLYVPTLLLLLHVRLK